MKLIEAMKSVKDLQVKADDLRKKIGMHSAHLSIENPVYKDQRDQLSSWLQSHEDITQKIGSLLVSISRTNLNTSVTITIGEKQVTKCITEWIARRRMLAKFDEQAWSQLTDRGLREGAVPSSAGTTPTPVTIVRYFDPAKRDSKVEEYKFEPSSIDYKLEIINAITDLVE